MDFLKNFVDVVLHIDQHLADFVNNYGTWTYALLFLIVFCETGLVVMPFLPGDSLLFATGAIAAITTLDVWLVSALLIFAAIIGDGLNYYIGKKAGVKIVESGRYVKREHLERTAKFYEKHGGKTIVLARFLPILRTFAPFVAGMARMEYNRFVVFNIVGAFLWVGIFVGLGYKFGNHPEVKKNFSYVIIAIIVISLIPAVIEYFRHRRAAKTDAGS